jgi:hypothetical protein
LTGGKITALRWVDWGCVSALNQRENARKSDKKRQKVVKK